MIKTIKDRHGSLLKKMMEMNKCDLILLERSQVGEAEGSIYKVDCIPSAHEKEIVSGANLRISKQIKVRVAIKDLEESVSLDDTAKPFCSIHEIQKKIDKAMVGGQRYSISSTGINTFNTMVTLYLTIEE
ncbi:MAG: hypothetical protein ACRCZ9_05695 [Fusobacteriaceae bacterium]